MDNIHANLKTLLLLIALACLTLLNFSTFTKMREMESKYDLRLQAIETRIYKQIHSLDAKALRKINKRQANDFEERLTNLEEKVMEREDNWIGATGATGRRGKDVGSRSNIVRFIKNRLSDVEDTVLKEKENIDDAINMLNAKVQGKLQLYVFIKFHFTYSPSSELFDLNTTTYSLSRNLFLFLDILYRGQGGRVVNLSPPTSEIGVRFPA